MVADQFFADFFQFLLESRDQPDPSWDTHSQEYKFLNFAASFSNISRAQLFQDLWVLYELRTKRDGYFVEFGAADGVYLSNTFILEKHFGWTGALSEPNPVWHDRLYKNRSTFISPCCIDSRSHEIVQFHDTPLPELSTIYEYTEADMHAQARQGGHVIDVETLSLNDFLAGAGAPRTIDYLSVDTEGSEHDILAAFDFKKHDIRLITVEHNYTANREKMFDLLTRRGYTRKFAKFSRFDDWYVRDTTAAALGS